MTFAAQDVLDGLKPFQLDTVEYVFSRLFDDEDPVDRFLVADEVGLGKTMVARGLIAKLIEHHLQEDGRRIDVVYICSNQAIAQQNFSKLAIVGHQRKALTDRITTLPLHVKGLATPAEGFDRGINIIPITPTTSLDLRSNVGRADERALLWHMLSHTRLAGPQTMRRIGAKRIFVLPATAERLRWERDQIRPEDIDDELWSTFVNHVDALQIDGHSVVDEIEELADAFRLERRCGWPPWTGRRVALVGLLRRTLAESCVDALQPDLVILDEFQRFPRLLIEGNPTGDLAQQLFRYEGCKTLLLSATPYKMLSRARELDEDHHAEFLTTTRFLVDDGDRAQEIVQGMADYRAALRDLTPETRLAAASARDHVQACLLRVMSRTERLGAAGDRNGMLDTHPAFPLQALLETRDLRSYAELESVAREVGARDVVEFWKSAAFPLNLMDDYVLIREYERRARSTHPLPIRHRLSRKQVRAYARIDPGNARLRGLLAQLDSEGAWKCLWLPPSLPYYTPSRPFSDITLRTKRLIFSEWQVVPKAIAALTSYHVDRAILAHANAEIENTPEGRRTLGQPLQWRADGPMTELLLLAPTAELARLTDPLTLARDLSDNQSIPSRQRLLHEAQRRVTRAVRSLELPTRGGREDSRWYLLAAALLDERANPGTTSHWLNRESLPGDEPRSAWPAHVRALSGLLADDSQLGAVPADLAAVLTYIGVAGPGCCALRALTRKHRNADVAREALRLANGLRLMLDLPESVAIVRGFATARSRIQTRDSEVFWRAVLDYCLAGNLQAVLDEYVHVLRDWVGDDGDDRIVDTAVEAIGVQAASLTARDIRANGTISNRPIAFRSRFALRLGDGQGEDEKTVQRVASVRKAFNSPFWPFILATTSIGQEGLDFHLYAHAVVHWNLPHNPVDLEQREGRVHRFKNHAVRRNLADRLGSVGIASAPHDPWRAMFDHAGEDARGLQPYWIFRGSAQIERHVPAESMSIDRHRLDELVRLMGIYRLAFGQPRQDELLAALAASGVDGETATDLIMDLTPPPAP